MKKIFLLLILCIIKLNAYDYEFYVNSTTNTVPVYIAKYLFFNDSKGNLRVRRINLDPNNTSNQFTTPYNQWYVYLNSIKSNAKDYIKNDVFEYYLKSDKKFLNDFYTQATNYILNYFYNENSFSSSNYIVYIDYELLYNDDGLVVESIVNGKWAGLYEDSGQSGYLYNEKGDLIYVNGQSASFFEKINNRLLRKFKINLESIFIKNIFYPLLVLIFACVIFRSVIRMAFKAFLIRFYDKKIGQLEKRRENIENA